MWFYPQLRGDLFWIWDVVFHLMLIGIVGIL